MKAILEFNLPEERAEYELAVTGAELQAAVSDFDNWLRSTVKYSEKRDWPNAEQIRQRFIEMIGDLG